MKNLKLLVLGMIISSFVLTGCSSSSEKLSLTLDNVSWRGDKFLNFDVYLERPDLGVKEPVGEEHDFGSSGLPKTINPRLMYVSTPDDEGPESGNMCNRSAFPHRCSVYLKGDDVEKSSHDFLVKITFVDGTYVAKEISVPMPEKLELPAISEPNTVPKQDEAFFVKFKDVGADKYKVDVNMCEPYGNNGINPCLDGASYLIERRSGKLVAAETDEFSKFVINEKDGVVEVKSELKLKFTDSVEYYVTAEKSGEIAGVETFVDLTDSKTFPVK
ncbi:MAG: hypothetical protein WC651_05640 [Candidatus Gracilibacteria bacterium]|jgi:hypothetical protein